MLVNSMGEGQFSGPLDKWHGTINSPQTEWPDPQQIKRVVFGHCHSLKCAQATHWWAQAMAMTQNATTDVHYGESWTGA